MEAAANMNKGDEESPDIHLSVIHNPQEPLTTTEYIPLGGDAEVTRSNTSHVMIEGESTGMTTEERPEGITWNGADLTVIVPAVVSMQTRMAQNRTMTSTIVEPRRVIKCLTKTPGSVLIPNGDRVPDLAIGVNEPGVLQALAGTEIDHGLPWTVVGDKLSLCRIY